MAAGKQLLVDGSNVMNAWPELRALLRRDRDAARAKLSRAVAVLHDAEQVRVTLVFDGRGTELIVERPSGRETFLHVYTPSGRTADDVIERLVGQAGSPGDYLVATDDRAQRRLVAGLGATPISTEELAAWIGRAESRQSSWLSGRRSENDRDWKQGPG